MADVSVIIPSHNVRHYIGPCLESILAQTEPVREVIVVDDSSDGSGELIQAYARSSKGLIRLVEVEHVPDSQSRNRNIGLAHAAGSLIAYLDADDLWMPEKIAKQVAVLDAHPEAVASHSGLFFFRESLDDEGRRGWDRIADDPTVADIILMQAVPASTVLVRREALEDVAFDESSGHGEDTIWAASLRLKGRWRLAEGPLTARRLHDTQVTRSIWHGIYHSETRARWVREHAEQIGEDVAAEIEDRIGRQVIEMLERQYWNRQLDDLPALCERARRSFPDHFARSTLAHRRIWPRWVYAIADRLKGRGRDQR